MMFAKDFFIPSPLGIALRLCLSDSMVGGSLRLSQPEYGMIADVEPTWTENRARCILRMQEDESLINIAAFIDRSLPVPLGVQLRGLLEYGIACSELPGGVRLPSVRELSDASGLAPMTVSAVYRELRAAGLIHSRPGAGTFVADPPPASRATAAVQALQAQIDQVVAGARTAGLAPLDVLAMVNARLVLASAQRKTGVRLRMVGVFAQATRAYAEEIARHLRSGDQIDFVTIEQLKGQKALEEPVDLYVTMANRRAEVAALVGASAPVVCVSLIPSENTRALLAKIDPLARVCVVSVFPEFLALMKPGVKRFTPHVTTIEAALLGEDGLAQRLSRADVIVYSTGAEAVLAGLGPGVTAMEYRHMPDPHSIQRDLLPAVEAMRVQTRLEETSHENQRDELVAG